MLTTQSPKASTKPSETQTPLHVQLKRSPVLSQLHLSGEPLTRENYLDLAYMGNPPAELSAEEEANLPEIIRQQAPTSPSGQQKSSADDDPQNNSRIVVEPMPEEEEKPAAEPMNTAPGVVNPFSPEYIDKVTKPGGKDPVKTA